MQITVFSGFSKEHNSTKQPSGGTAVNCYLKDDTSLINPIFILDSGNFSINYVQWGSRYYFVDDIVSIRNSTVELHCSVDAMASWKASIGASSQYVTRSASQYDEAIIDRLYPARVMETVSDTVVDLNLSADQAKTTYVVGIVNYMAEASGGVMYYLFTPAMFAQLLQYMFGGNWLDAPITEVSIELQKELVNPFQYIVSVQAFPYDLFDSNLPTAHVAFGYWEMNPVMGTYYLTPEYRYLQVIASADLPAHPQASSRGIYLNASPFTRRTLHCYGFGSIPLDPVNFIHNSRITLHLSVDKFNGVGKLTISNTGDTDTYETLFGEVGIPIPISQVTSNLMGAVGAVLSVPVAMAGASLAGATGAVLGSTGALSGIGNAVESLMPSIQSSGSVGSGVYYIHRPHVTSQFMNLAPIDVERNGRPLMQTKTINTLSGFIQVENPDVDIPATTQEKDIIANYMRSGFYYE